MENIQLLKHNMLDKYLIEAGSSVKKLMTENKNLALKLLAKVSSFIERQFNVSGKIPIFLDLDGYLHIYMRHVKEMKVTKHFEHKDNFQWFEEDVMIVMDQILKDLNNEIQNYFEKNPGQKYQRYGKESVYFEGDYYNFYIEPSGRLVTFFKNRKKLCI